MFNDLTTRWGRWAFFGGGKKKTTLPAQPDPAPTPQQVDIEAQRKAEDIRKKLHARTGRAGTILTEGGLGTAEIGKSILLGGKAT